MHQETNRSAKGEGGRGQQQWKQQRKRQRRGGKNAASIAPGCTELSSSNPSPLAALSIVQESRLQRNTNNLLNFFFPFVTLSRAIDVRMRANSTRIECFHGQSRGFSNKYIAICLRVRAAKNVKRCAVVRVTSESAPHAIRAPSSSGTPFRAWPMPSSAPRAALRIV